jgi:hypothetical protein
MAQNRENAYGKAQIMNSCATMAPHRSYQVAIKTADLAGRQNDTMPGRGDMPPGLLRERVGGVQVMSMSSGGGEQLTTTRKAVLD